MGLFDVIFKNRPKKDSGISGTQDFKMFNGYTPRFTSWGGEISDS